MPHIHIDRDQHDFTATAYIIRTDGDEPRALLHMHKKLGRLLPVGGHIELDETPWGAMAHELEEESGYRLDQLKVLQPYDTRITPKTETVHPLPFSINTHEIPSDELHWHTDMGYLFITSSAPASTLADGESADLRWLTHDEVAVLGDEAVFGITKVNYLLIFDTLLSSWQQFDATDYRTDKRR
jgi:NTP pyrophosphohydrolases including oxidative damage repair enzymes